MSFDSTGSSRGSSSSRPSAPPRYQSVDSVDRFAEDKRDEAAAAGDTHPYHLGADSTMEERIAPPEYPPGTRSDGYMVQYGKERRDSSWSVSLLSDADRRQGLQREEGEHDDEEEDEEDDGEYESMTRKKPLRKGWRSDGGPRGGPGWIRWRDSRPPHEDGWNVGGRWRGTVLAVSGLVVLVLLLIGTSIKVVERRKHDSIVLLSPKEATDVRGAVSVVGEVVPLDPEDGRYVLPAKSTLEREVGDAPRFLVMDANATASYHDQRVIFETTLNLARVAKRLPVIPGHIWAKSCRVDSAECTQYSLDDTSSERFEELRERLDGEAWKIGIEHFMDIPHLRKTYGLVLTQAEYFTLFNDSLDPSIADPRGRWGTETHTPEGLTSSEITIFDWYNDREFTRLDHDLPIWVPIKSEAEIEGLGPVRARELQEEDSTRVWTLARAAEVLENHGFKVNGDDKWLEEALQKVGQAKVYSFDHRINGIKATVLPNFEMVDRSRAFSFESQFLSQRRHENASILYISGPLHEQGKIGGVRFSTEEARDRFAEMVKTAIRPPKEYIEVGKMIAAKMSKLNEGRRWISTELNQKPGQALSGWRATPEGRIIKHLRLHGRAIKEMNRRKLDRAPKAGDVFFLATDETDPAALATYRRYGAMLLTDLLSREELKVLGWRALFSDLLELVVQEVMSGSDYFVGSETSALTGGVVNARHGPRFDELDWCWTLGLQ